MRVSCSLACYCWRFGGLKKTAVPPTKIPPSLDLKPVLPNTNRSNSKSSNADTNVIDLKTSSAYQFSTSCSYQQLVQTLRQKKWRKSTKNKLQHSHKSATKISKCFAIDLALACDIHIGKPSVAPPYDNNHDNARGTSPGLVSESPRLLLVAGTPSPEFAASSPKMFSGRCRRLTSVSPTHESAQPMSFMSTNIKHAGKVVQYIAKHKLRDQRLRERKRTRFGKYYGNIIGDGEMGR